MADERPDPIHREVGVGTAEGEKHLQRRCVRAGGPDGFDKFQLRARRQEPGDRSLAATSQGPKPHLQITEAIEAPVPFTGMIQGRAEIVTEPLPQATALFQSPGDRRRGRRTEVGRRRIQGLTRTESPGDDRCRFGKTARVDRGLQNGPGPIQLRIRRRDPVKMVQTKGRGNQRRIAPGIGRQLLPLGGRPAGWRGHQTGGEHDPVLRDQPGKPAGHQGRIGIVDLMEIQDFMRLSGPDPGGLEPTPPHIAPSVRGDRPGDHGPYQRLEPHGPDPASCGQKL